MRREKYSTKKNALKLLDAKPHTRLIHNITDHRKNISGKMPYMS